jgi:HEAT repeat protein
MMLLRIVFGGVILGVLMVFPGAKSFARESPEEFLQLVVKLIGDSDREFRAAGLEQVRAQAGGTAGTRLFANQLPKLDSAGQTALVSALAERGDPAARPAIFSLMEASADDDVRAAAIQALGNLGAPADLPWLITSLSSKSAVERAAARAALTQIRGETTNTALATKLPLVSPEIKSVLIEVLAARRASDALPAFLVASCDDNAQVRTASMAALGQLGGADELAAMLPGILKAEGGGERDAAEKSVALVCARIDNEDERSRKLIEALETVELTQRDELLSLVGRVGGKKLIDFVAQIATGADPDRRKLGVDALSKWPDASTADKLLEIAKNANDSAERSRAFQGYVKIAAIRDQRSDRQRLDRMKQAMQVAKSNEERLLVIVRCRTAYDVETLRFVRPYLDEAFLDQTACETIVELAHHREIRDPHRVEFNAALDKVLAVSKNPEVIERAKRYQRGETWERQTKAAN